MLQGIRVIEIEGLGPAPFAAMMLADLGADVICVHRKGDNTGLMPPHPIIDRGKRSITLDLKSDADVETLLQLVESADVLIEGFRPGVMERLGLGPAACHVAVKVFVLVKPHRDANFSSTLLAALRAAITARISAPCAFSLELAYTGPFYITGQHQP